MVLEVGFDSNIEKLAMVLCGPLSRLRLDHR